MQTTSPALLVRPMAMTSANTTGNVAENPPAQFVLATSYDAGALVARYAVGGGAGYNPATVWESLQAANLGNLPETSPAWWRAMGTAWPAWSAATAYSVGNEVVHQHVVHQAIAASIGVAPGAGSTEALASWAAIGPSNAWAMFDRQPGTQTAWPDQVAVSVQVSGRADSVALINLDASAVRLVVRDGAEVVSDESYSLSDDSGVSNWYDYFFEPIERRSELFVTGLANVHSPAIGVTVTGEGMVRVGHCAIGLSAAIGEVEIGATAGFRDLTKVTVDDLGEVDAIVPRALLRDNQFVLWVEAERVDFVERLLRSYHAVPVILIGSDAYACTWGWGLLKASRVAISYPTHSIFDLEMQGF